MFGAKIVLCVIALFASVSGFRPLLLHRSQTRLSAVAMPPQQRGHKSMDGKNWMEQLLQAFIQSIPEVLRPPREMDPSKVVFDPPTYDKVHSALSHNVSSYKMLPIITYVNIVVHSALIIQRRQKDAQEKDRGGRSLS